MRAPRVRALGLLSGDQGPAADLPGGRGAGHPVLSLGRPSARSDRQRRATRECLLALAAVEAMLEDGKAGREAIAGERTALLYATAAGYGASNREFIDEGRGIHFAYTAPAVVPAEVAIEFGLTGAYAIFIGGAPATLRAIWQAAALLEAGTCDRALVLAVEIFDECADLFAKARRLTGGPLIETAGCLWLEPGEGTLTFESSRARGRRMTAGIGERLGGGPLAELDRWRATPAGRPPALAGDWRGERARVVWSESGPIGASGG